MGAAGSRIRAANLEREPDCVRRVSFISKIVLIGAVNVANELLRPMTVLAGFTCRAQIFDGRFDWPVELTGHYADELMDAVHFGFHECLGPVSNVAIHAGHPRVW